MTNTNQPLYKELFEKITKGEETRVTEWNEITFSRPGIVEGRKSLCQVSDFGKKDTEVRANAKYLKLAWENLHILAEALEYFATLPLAYAEMQGMTKEVIKAKEALNRIS